jgi:hypothetical protein
VKKVYVKKKVYVPVPVVPKEKKSKPLSQNYTGVIAAVSDFM